MFGAPSNVPVVGRRLWSPRFHFNNLLNIQWGLTPLILDLSTSSPWSDLEAERHPHEKMVSV